MDLLLQLCAALKLKEVVLVGHADGALVALMAAFVATSGGRENATDGIASTSSRCDAELLLQELDVVDSGAQHTAFRDQVVSGFSAHPFLNLYLSLCFICLSAAFSAPSPKALALN